mgnify:CR=1 FL=1
MHCTVFGLNKYINLKLYYFIDFLTVNSVLQRISKDNIRKYEPYNNNSVAINTNDSTVDDWIKVINKILS